MKCNCVELSLRFIFRSYSKLLCAVPLPVIFLSLFAALGLGSGVYFLTFETGAEYLFSPITSRAKDDRITVTELFPVNDSYSLPNRRILFDHRRVSIIFTCKDGGNILRREYLDDILQIDEEIRTATVYSEENDSPFNYSDVCSQWKGECFPNQAIEYFRNLDGGAESVLTIPYPEIVLSGIEYNTEGYFGGEQVENGQLFSAVAFTTTYFLRHAPKEDNILSENWETSVLNFLTDSGSDLIESWGFHSGSLDEAQINLTRKAIPYVGGSYAVLVCFAIISCIMVRDSRQSKPWLGLMGVVAASMAMVSSVGLLSYCGVPFNQVTLSMPFIILGIGLDDMFIMNSAWRMTDINLSVKKRMAATYEDAAVSITITSLTDIIAFCVGAICPTPAVRIFCLYTGVAVFFAYIYQITFFGGCMVLFGHMESSNCSGLSCIVNDEAKPEHEGSRPNGHAPSTTSGRTKVKQHVVMVFFRDYYAKLISHPICMVTVVFIYIVYLGVAVYFCTNIKLGLEQKNIAEDGTVAHEFLTLYSEYFKENTRGVSIIMTEPYDYWELAKQNDLERVIDQIHENYYVRSRNYTEFWLDDFKQYLMAMYNTTDVYQDTFVFLLQEHFLKLPCCERYALDINFDGNQVSSSRLILATENAKSTTDDEELLLSLRKNVDDATEILGVPVIAYSSAFVFIEQYVIIVSTTIQTLSIAVASMLVVSLLMLPNIAVAVMVTMSVASILVGVVGYMVFWEVALESISMINLVLCIGFSVDFSAHVAYAYVMSRSSEEDLSVEEKLSRAFFMLGYPILQSGWSTIIGVFMLFFSTSYIFRTFAKIMTLVMVLGMLHGLVFLPVAMAISSYIFQACCSCCGGDVDQRSGNKENGRVKTVSETIAADNLGVELD
ncbi:Patched domain-containing protein 3 [Holothuria leucospilota]|uniref:Patched domain-containing protein 3 n=1 Tax=Holothuria leucospilota TaxID=206669 RepID=A0A9Q1C1S4_HOLLE|nr:Patched domain-containing protein 3 [Holothuria leucospilota]